MALLRICCSLAAPNSSRRLALCLAFRQDHSAAACRPRSRSSAAEVYNLIGSLESAACEVKPICSHRARPLYCYYFTTGSQPGDQFLYISQRPWEDLNGSRPNVPLLDMKSHVPGSLLIAVSGLR